MIENNFFFVKKNPWYFKNDRLIKFGLDAPPFGKWYAPWGIKKEQYGTLCPNVNRFYLLTAYFPHPGLYVYLS